MNNFSGLSLLEDIKVGILLSQDDDTQQIGNMPPVSPWEVPYTPGSYQDMQQSGNMPLELVSSRYTSVSNQGAQQQNNAAWTQQESMLPQLQDTTQQKDSVIAYQQEMILSYGEELVTVSKDNLRLQEKVAKLKEGRKTPKEYAVEIVDDTIVILYSNEAGVVTRQELGENKISEVRNIILVRDGANANESFYRVTFSDNGVASPVLVIPQDKILKPETRRLIETSSQVCFKSTTISQSHIDRAFGNMLQRMANGQKPIVIFERSGWNKDTSTSEMKFFHLDPKEAWVKELTKHVDIPIMKKELPDALNDIQVKGVLKQANLKGLWQAFVFGAPIKSLLAECGITLNCIFCIADDKQMVKNANHYYAYWSNKDNIMPSLSKKNIKEFWDKSKDEVVGIKAPDMSKKTKEGLLDMMDCYMEFTEKRHEGEEKGIPLVICDDFGLLLQLYQAYPLQVYPLFSKGMDVVKGYATAVIPHFIRWCEKNIEYVQEVSKLLYSTDEIYKEEIAGQDTIKTLCVVCALAELYELYFKTGELCPYPEYLEKGSFLGVQETLLGELKNVELFFKQSMLEKVRPALKKAFDEDKLCKISNDKVTEEEILQNGCMVYDSAGNCYFTREAFGKAVENMEYYDVGAVLMCLAGEESIKTESGNRYEVKCAVPKGCGKNQRRMIKFPAGTIASAEEVQFWDGKEDAMALDHSVTLGEHESGEYKVRYPMDNRSGNHSMLVTGQSGSGKSNFFHVMMEEMKDKGITSVLFDYSGSAEKDKLPRDGSVIFKKIEELKCTPFWKREDESIPAASRRFAELLKNAFGFGDKQAQKLKTVVKALLQEKKVLNFQSIYAKLQEMEQQNEGFRNGSDLSKLKMYNDLELFAGSDNKGWDFLYEGDAKIVVIEFSSFSENEQVFLMELMLASLFQWLVAKGAPACDKQLEIFLDEAQKLSQSPTGSLSKFLREGRKYHCGVAVASQSLVTFSPEMQEVLQQAGVIVAFQQQPKAAKQLADVFVLWENTEQEQDYRANQKRMEQKLQRLPRGTAVMYAQFLKESGKLMSKTALTVKVKEACYCGGK